MWILAEAKVELLAPEGVDPKADGWEIGGQPRPRMLAGGKQKSPPLDVTSETGYPAKRPPTPLLKAAKMRAEALFL
jgi:hypothetical protein